MLVKENAYKTLFYSPLAKQDMEIFLSNSNVRYRSIQRIAVETKFFTGSFVMLLCAEALGILGFVITMIMMIDS